MLAVWLVLAVAGAYAWVVCGPIVFVVVFCLPFEVLGDRLRRRRERLRMAVNADG